MCHRRYQVETDSLPCSLCMPARERIFSREFLTFIARGLQSLQQIMHRVKHSFQLFPPNLVFSRFSPAEPSRGALQGPQTRPQAQSHGGPEEQAAASRGGLVRRAGQRQRQRQRPGTRSGPEQDVHVGGSSSSAHGYELSGRNKYVKGTVCLFVYQKVPRWLMPWQSTTLPHYNKKN